MLLAMQRVVERHLLDRTGLKREQGQPGTVMQIQRFGSAATKASYVAGRSESDAQVSADSDSTWEGIRQAVNRLAEDFRKLAKDLDISRLHDAVPHPRRLRSPMVGSHGGLGLGTTVTSFLFLAVIASIVLYMTLTTRGEVEAYRDRHS